MSPPRASLYESLEQAPPTPSPPAPPTPLLHIPLEMPLPYMYETFPELLLPVGSVSDEVLEAMRAKRWHERAERILDDVTGWSQSVKEWKKVKAEMEADPSIYRVRREACIEVAQNYTNYLLSNLGRRIYFESNAEERARMPPPSASAFDIINWGRAEAKTPAGRAR
ncbi:uncharacterized protein [Triticum aestivum]|uniref:uncharacterized protein n=1 Tax=Triticum aestivum TaxID=4565 RepID=UPI001D01D7CC|nr:uncharacterized protein LOC123049518 [Triticum aestivum]